MFTVILMFAHGFKPACFLCLALAEHLLTINEHRHTRRVGLHLLLGLVLWAVGIHYCPSWTSFFNRVMGKASRTLARTGKSSLEHLAGKERDREMDGVAWFVFFSFHLDSLSSEIGEKHFSTRKLSEDSSGYSG